MPLRGATCCWNAAIEAARVGRETRFAFLERNRRIAEMCDRMVAFWHKDSGGTANAVCWAVALGKPVEVRRPR